MAKLIPPSNRPRTVEGPVVGAIYNVSTLAAIDENLKSISSRGREWDPDRDLLLDARLILMCEELTGMV